MNDEDAADAGIAAQIWPRATVSWPLVPATPMTHTKAGVLAFTLWFDRPIGRCDQLPSAHGSPTPGTTKPGGRAE